MNMSARIDSGLYHKVKPTLLIYPSIHVDIWPHKLQKKLHSSTGEGNDWCSFPQISSVINLPIAVQPRYCWSNVNIRTHKEIVDQGELKILKPYLINQNRKMNKKTLQRKSSCFIYLKKKSFRISYAVVSEIQEFTHNFYQELLRNSRDYSKKSIRIFYKNSSVN